ncbi:hypothetical protein [Streptomyces kronopolitis]|uniref:hypothetical protein n=1 Tax=Streptomyces kronopolitis TaxID=1612435 RepID=UPI003D974C1A
MEFATMTAADHVLSALKGRGHTVGWWWDNVCEAMAIELHDGSVVHISDSNGSADHYPVQHLIGWWARHYPGAAAADFTSWTTIYQGQTGGDFTSDTRACVAAVDRFITSY